MSTTPKKVMLALAGTVLLGCGLEPAMAAVTPIAWYRLGEADGVTGAPPILATIPTQDSVSGNNLTPYASQGSAGPWYDHPGYSPLTPGSTHFVAFDYSHSNYYNSPTSVATGTVNWGVEAWVWSNSTANNTLLCNGRGSGSNVSGVAIIQNEGYFKGLLNGRAFVGQSSIVTGQWVHLALVNTDDLNTFYVNGASAGSVGAAVIVPIDGLTIGAGQNGTGQGFVGDFSNFWNGGLDEVRFFTFGQGDFSTSDLLYPTVPEPAALSLLGLAVLGLWRRRA